MSVPAAMISASLVDVRNIAAHRCVRLEIHVPVEQAGDVMAAFGWPTGADPVPVVIARLTAEAAERPPQAREDGKVRRQFCDLPFPQQAALKCSDDSFRRYLGVATENEAADFVRQRCNVSSRKEIGHASGSKEAWITLLRAFDDWERRAA